MDRPTHCETCREALVPLSVTHQAENAGEVIEIENVPALVCLSCGERWFEQATLDTIDQIIIESRRLTYQDIIREIEQNDDPAPLTRRPAPANGLLARLKKTSPSDLFPESRSPEAAMAGLLLLAGGWREAHEAAQSIDTPEGSYWHAIVHRMEPDESNARYWFRHLGDHAIFPQVLEIAAQAAHNRPFAGFRPGDRWDPMAFVAFFEKARTQPDSEVEWLARDIQSAECRLLFEYCAAKPE